MPYAGQVWTDGVTPLDSTHMSALDAGVVGAVDVDNVAVAAGQLVANKLLAADAQPAFKILGDGTHSWGPGGATAPDTDLYRSAAATLKSDGQFKSASALTSFDGNAAAQIALTQSGGNATIYFGSASDTNLYRVSSGLLKTDQNFRAGLDLYAQDGGATQVRIGNNSGRATIDFGSAFDTNLYRWASVALRTNSAFYADGPIQSGSLAAQAIVVDGPQNKITYAGDTNLYRAGAGDLRTDSILRANGNNAGMVTLGGNGTTPTIYFGNALDTNLYRNGAGQLRTDSLFLVIRPTVGDIAHYLSLPGDGSPRYEVFADGKTWWGPGNAAVDTNLYRSAAGLLKTDGNMHIVNDLGVRIGAASQMFVGAAVGGLPGLLFGSAADTTLYRVAANTLKTDGNFQCGLSSVGARQLDVGAADSGGAGYRMVRVTN